MQEAKTCIEDEKAFRIVSVASPKAAIRGQKWSTRLKQALSRRGGQPRPLLPLCHNDGEGDSSQSKDSDTERLLGFDGAWDSRRCQGDEVNSKVIRFSEYHKNHSVLLFKVVKDPC